MFWMIIGVMLVAAVLVVAVPLYRAEKKLSATNISAVVAIAAVSSILYAQIGTPNPDLSATPAGDMPSIEEMVDSLAERLKSNPDDLAGWKMLGRSYLQMQNFPGAVAAFEKAVEMENGENGQTLADLGEAVLMSDGSTLLGRAGQLFENALALQPANPKALFYSGMAAVQRGDNELAATRWEALLATSPPPNVQDILRQRIAELRGEAPQTTPPAPQPAQSGAVVTANVSLGASAQAAELPDSTVFVIVRDPNQPTPPVAAVRRRLAELPATVEIGDGDAMIPGRVPSAFQQLEVIARISLTGEPVAQPGDWYGALVYDAATAGPVTLVIDEQVP